LDETNELNVEWDGDASAGAKAIADHFKKEGWDSAWFQGGNTRRFRALHVESGRDIQGRITPPPPKGFFGRFLSQDSKCLVTAKIQSQNGDVKALEATILKVLKSVGRA
jgi:hypothetical protein